MFQLAEWVALPNGFLAVRGIRLPIPFFSGKRASPTNSQQAEYRQWKMNKFPLPVHSFPVASGSVVRPVRFKVQGAETVPLSMSLPNPGLPAREIQGRFGTFPAISDTFFPFIVSTIAPNCYFSSMGLICTL
jgi:hypothetical protein